MQLYSQPELQDAHESVFIAGRPTPPSVLPPKTSQGEFDALLRELSSIVGDSNVVSGTDLTNFVDPFALHQEHVPSAAVCPANVNEIQTILKVMNRVKIPLWTCSRGKNLGYGGPAPRVRGSIILSLHRMTRILEVDEKAAFAVVEPGVTFAELSAYCLDNKPSVWPSIPGLGWGSVVGNHLERGYGYNILGDHYHSICGMEVVLANGDLVRTGQWAADGSPTAHVCKNSFGPQIDGLFLQSNLGIVTKMGVWLQPRPEAYMSVIVQVATFEDVEPLLEALSTLHRMDILQNNPLFGDVMGTLSTMKTAAELYQGEGPIPDAKIVELQEQHGLGFWTSLFDFYGTKEMIYARLDKTKSVIHEHCPNAKVVSKFFEGESGHPLDARAIAAVGIGESVGVVGKLKTSMMNFALPGGGRGHGAHTDFIPVLPHDGSLTLKWLNDCRKIVREYGLNPLVGGRYFKRYCLLITAIIYDADNESHLEKIPKIRQALAKKAEEYHFTAYRSHLDNMDQVQNSFNFNSYAYRRLIEDIKEKLDPNGILSPGKQGIWPIGQRDAAL